MIYYTVGDLDTIANKRRLVNQYFLAYYRPIPQQRAAMFVGKSRSRLSANAAEELQCSWASQGLG